MTRETENGIIDLATINEIGEELVDAPNKHARTIGAYLTTYGSAGYASVPDPIVVARKVVLSMQRSTIAKQRSGLGSRKYRGYSAKRSYGKPAWLQRRHLAVMWTGSFLKRLIAKLREQICGAKGAKKKGRTSRRKTPYKGSYGYAVATSLASYIMHAMHISSSVALGLAALILLKIAQSTMDTFCEMTDEEILEALLKKPC
jgi:hypothetical protein